MKNTLPFTPKPKPFPIIFLPTDTRYINTNTFYSSLPLLTCPVTEDRRLLLLQRTMRPSNRNTCRSVGFFPVAPSFSRSPSGWFGKKGKKKDEKKNVTIVLLLVFRKSHSTCIYK